MPTDNQRYPYWPLPARPPLKWPNEARVAFWIIPNVEHFRFDKLGPGSTLSPDVYEFAVRDYGARVGIWRMMDILDKYQLRATVALNADVCRFEPDIVKAGMERRWEWMGHGITNSQRLTGLSEDDERGLIRQVVDTIASTTGAAPTGWLGPGLGETDRTPDLLAEAGITYVADWVADDQPFPMRVKSGRLISVPYSQELNDIPVFTRKGLTPEQFYQLVCDQFDVLYDEGGTSGRVMALALHPFLSGHPFRARWLDRALQHITSHPDVWLTTGGEIARWYYERYYDAAPK
ncbi:MAG TPA: polysaccharide deacetylase family protein [Chloroflexota bacterium]|nr:polysaccharide deacetylase family protein [Chloroflexota bacterium]